MIWDPNTAPIGPKPIFSESPKKCRDYQKKFLENIFGKVVFGHPTFEILVCKSELYRVRIGPHYHPEKTKIRNLRFHPYFTKMFSDIQKKRLVDSGAKNPGGFQDFFFLLSGSVFFGKKKFEI